MIVRLYYYTKSRDRKLCIQQHCSKLADPVPLGSHVLGGFAESKYRSS